MKKDQYGPLTLFSSKLSFLCACTVFCPSFSLKPKFSPFQQRQSPRPSHFFMNFPRCLVKVVWEVCRQFRDSSFWDLQGLQLPHSVQNSSHWSNHLSWNFRPSASSIVPPVQFDQLRLSFRFPSTFSFQFASTRTLSSPLPSRNASWFHNAPSTPYLWPLCAILWLFFSSHLIWPTLCSFLS